MKIAAVVILYHPGQDTMDNISSYANYVERIYVFDNTEQASKLRSQLLSNPKIHYYQDGENQGIAKRLNTAAKMAIEDGVDWLLMMDQDSSFTKPMIENYFVCFHQYIPKNDVAMIGVNFEQQPQSTDSICNAVLSDELITSGTLLNLDLFKVIGGFDEQLFIDGVDHEYTIRTLLAGFKIVQFTNIQLVHSLGTLVKKASVKTLFLVKKQKRIHSPLRCYYVHRNNLYLQKKYKNTTVVSMDKLDKMANANISNSFFYGENPLQVIRYVFFAKRDARINKMGKYSRG
jgi:rhamnosyltransferase